MFTNVTYAIELDLFLKKVSQSQIMNLTIIVFRRKSAQMAKINLTLPKINLIFCDFLIKESKRLLISNSQFDFFRRLRIKNLRKLKVKPMTEYSNKTT